MNWRTGFPSRNLRRCAWACIAVLLGVTAASSAAEDTAKPAEEAKLSPIAPPVSQRFAQADVTESPDFVRHVVPLLGRLGCNGRSCHGSFQGQGGFRLSLFGYDVKADHEALAKGEDPRVNLKSPAESSILAKPTLAIPHEGGERMKVGSWEYRLLEQWIKTGAQSVGEGAPTFVRLDVTPSEIPFSKPGTVVKLQAIAVWSDGRREDVTPLCRFQTNDETIAAIDVNGVVTGGEPGDTNVVAFYDRAVVTIPVMRPVSNKVGPNYPDVPTPTEIDRLVVGKLKKLGIVPSELSSDAEFLRRVSLDMTGTLPTAAEVEAFLADSTADKRDRKIEELLERPAFAAWWATRFADWTGNNPQQLNNVSPAQNTPSRDWYEWIQKRIADNTPYDQIVAGIVLASGPRPNQSFRDYSREMSDLHRPDSTRSFAEVPEMPYFWARRNLRQPEEKALAFAYSFMGIRIQCAQCHKHPFDIWTQDDYKQFQNFFTRINYGVNPENRKEQQKLLEELGVDGKKGGNDQRRMLQTLLKEGKVVPFEGVYVLKSPRNNRPANKGNQNRRNARADFAGSARVLGGEMIDLVEVDDPRIPLMDWLRSRENPYFAKAIVNRVWANYFNVGIVEPPDDHSLANPPSNRELLDYLAEQFIERQFDLKWLHREITRSRTYQLSWTPNETNKFDERNFSRSIPRRIPAEVAYDAVRQATANDAEVAEMQTSLKGRAIAGGGPNNRDQSSNAYALTVFGRSSRDSNCDCDRSMEPSLLQTVFLRNDQSVLDMIGNPRTGWAAQVTGPGESRPAPPTEKTVGARREARALEAEIAQLEKRLEEAKKSNKEERIKKVNDRLAELRKQVKSVREVRAERRGAKDAEVKPASKTQSPEEIVRLAYLRTLSRVPDQREMETSLTFLKESKSLSEGTNGLLWALLNTKEFIVNH